jgi:hypothetical protein
MEVKMALVTVKVISLLVIPDLEAVIFVVPILEP